ncbi:MAG: outer membrane protein assembly factor, partial [Sphingobacteriales bacterium]|nr:outer membrane protein assembly factor [Sphingobacteriales bacterium]
MHRIYQNLLLLLIVSFIGTVAVAQEKVDSSIIPEPLPVTESSHLQDILHSKTPRSYTIDSINITGNRTFDKNLIISISGLAVGDKIQLPGTDAFSKAIFKLWKQNIISNTEIYITRVSETRGITIEIAVTERPRLSEFRLLGIKKSEKEDLQKKIALSKDKVVTENMKRSAEETIVKFYTEKGYQNVTVSVKEEKIQSTSIKAIRLIFTIDKGNKVKINSINFTGNNHVVESKLKKQMSGTKEVMRFTLFPLPIQHPYGADTTPKVNFNQYLRDYGFLSLSQTGEILDPYFRIKFSASKFNATKYTEDKYKIVDYYNSQGFRDAVIVADTNISNIKGNRDIFIKVEEGRKYYFGTIVWRG